MSTAAPANRLGTETSPYLRQHAGNPVDWYPWGPEALDRARRLDRPIFLSIGYAACHWCHVMEHESFEDGETAKLLNDNFVCIKVDREERPDLDAIYMTAVQILNQGQGGWPMSVWLTPDLDPFYAGTYYPPEDKYGRPSFRRILQGIITAWKDRRTDVSRSATEITQYVKQTSQVPEGTGELNESLLRQAATQLRRAYDPVHGGFGGAPKFPHAIELRLLLRCWKRFGDENALQMVRDTLEKMARGGIYDHLGGGFHRYSVDARWLVPHFEKMLYDNALLAVAYLETFQATGESDFRRVVEETLDYILREMTSPPGGFYSTQDADSEGVEGKFYVWSEAEIEQALGKNLADVFTYVYDVSAEGNFEGHNILNRAKSDEQDAKLLKLSRADLRDKLAEARKRLLEIRDRRIKPGRDEKILTSWNALMISAFARAGAVLDRPDYVAAAVRASDFVLTRLRTPNGRLMRTATADGPAKLNGYLEDYAFLIDALTHVYEATFEPRWLPNAAELTAVMIEQFGEPTGGGFFTTATDHEHLIARLKDTHDGSTPSGNAMAVTGLLRLAEFLGRDDFRKAAEDGLTAFRGVMDKSPHAAAQMLIALDFHLGPVQQVAIVGNDSNDEVRQVLRAARTPFRPNRVVALADPARPVEWTALPLLKDKPPQGAVTTFVCENYACQAPMVGVAAATDLLEKT